MSTVPALRRVLLRILGMAMVGALLGLLLSALDVIPGLRFPPAQITHIPLPHQIPKYPGGVALRFAMVHDVIHERYPRHGKAYYQERNRLAQEAIAREKRTPSNGKPSARYLALLDDLGAGLDSIGEYDEAVRVLRGKLAEETAAGLKGRALYTTYANLGTFLIHGSLGKAQRGDVAAGQRLREGLAFIHKSIAVNPEAHFGREIWQAVATEFLIAAIESPTLLSKYDLTGNRLDQGPHYPHKPRASTLYGRDFESRHKAYEMENQIRVQIKQPEPDKAAALRRLITQTGGEGAWKEEVQTSHPDSGPFDEPVLGIVGMWRLGSGANPHFALMLGETMLRAGQRYVAWCAYERAIGLAERFSPDAAIQEQFVAHCRSRQDFLGMSFAPEEAEQLRRRFEAELAYGRRYHEAQHRYEEERIKAGHSIDDPRFYDDFHARHSNIASRLGDADFLVVEESSRVALFPGPVLLAGLFAFITALVLCCKRTG